MTGKWGGDHYKDMKIQVVEFCHLNGIGYMEGSAIKYLCRWRQKGGLEDLRKAITPGKKPTHPLHELTGLKGLVNSYDYLLF